MCRNNTVTPTQRNAWNSPERVYLKLISETTVYILNTEHRPNKEIGCDSVQCCIN